MAPATKRKRGDRTSSYDAGGDDSHRPSPYRPEKMSLGQQGEAHQHQQAPYVGRGGRRSQRGGRGGRGNFNSMGHSPRPSDGFEPLQNDTNVVERPLGQASNKSGQISPSPLSPLHQQPLAQSVKPTRSPEGTSRISPEVPALSPYLFEYLMPRVVQEWNNSGKNDFVDTALRFLRHGDTPGLRTVFQEIVKSGLDSRIDATEAGGTIQEILRSSSNSGGTDGTAAFMDIVSIVAESESQHPRLKDLVLSAGIPPPRLREYFDENLLLELGLVRPTFGRVFIRKQTNVLYRQSNYNLLREESEGFSKLMTELFTVVNCEPPFAEVVEDTFENMKALIGSFDLDAGRVLDVTLDLFASLLVKHYRFFVKFLRASSYWPQAQNIESIPHESQGFGSLPPWAEPGHSSWFSSDEEKNSLSRAKDDRDRKFWDEAKKRGMEAFFELGGRKVLDSSCPRNYIDSLAQSEDSRTRETKSWITDTGTLPPVGNSVAAQLLGFKLRFYASDARDPTDSLPVNLIYLAALLIKIGFISLRDLYNHLYPTDSAMEAVKEKQMKEKEEREQARRPGGGALNALARAGALPDESAPAIGRIREADGRAATPSRSDAGSAKPTRAEETEPSEPLPEPSDQKIELLRSLLCIGAIPEALYILGRFPWLPDAIPDLLEHIHRILHPCLSKVYESICPLNGRDSIRDSTRAAAISEKNALPKGDVQYADPTPRRVLRWAQIDKNDTNEGIDYRFYWDDWADNVPVCQTVDDVFVLCNTFLNLSGVKIGQDANLLMKLARIGKDSLAKEPTQANRSRWIDLCKRLLCPAMSLTKSNPGVVNEIFELLKMFSTKTRFSIYAEWFQGQTSRLPDVANAFTLAKLETKNTLKRINKTNTRQMARTLAKVSCATPGVVFDVVLNQIEAYENLIDVVVECGRYFTFMGYDVLTWSLLTFLGREGRSRVSDTGFATSSWLQKLSLFIGRVFRRYSLMNTLPVLQYVLHQLRQHNATDLRILRDLISNMAGVTPDTDFTEAQVLAMAGGELLQSQTLQQVHDKRHESRTPAKRLMKTLIDNNLAAAYVVSLAQERQMSIYFLDSNSNKVLSETFDEITIVMTQYLDMLKTHVSIKEFSAMIPDLFSLISEFGLEPGVAFTIHRKSIAQAITEYDAIHKSETLSPKDSNDRRASIDGDVDMVDVTEENAKENVTASAIEEKPLRGQDEIATDNDKKDAETPPERAGDSTTKVSDKALPVWHPVLHDIMVKLGPYLSDTLGSGLSVSFFVTFWQLSLSDFVAPSGSYDLEMNRQKARIAAINSDRSDISTASVKKKDQEKKVINATLATLAEEMKAHLRSYRVVHRRLVREKDYWFRGIGVPWRDVAMGILQECFLPRLLMSPLDSYYTQKFFFFLHSTGTAGFRTVGMLDQLFAEKTLTNIIFQCSGREAENLGRFLNEVMKALGDWHKDRTMYEKKAFGLKRDLPGFVRSTRPDGTPDTFLEYEDFRRVLYKWHRNLHESIKSCLTGFEYMHMKNAVNVLRAVSENFPSVNWMGNSLFKIAEEISVTEKPPARDEPSKPLAREDLWVAASSLLGALKKREKKWVLPQEFYIKNTAPQKNARESERSASAAPKSPQNHENISKQLNAAAPDFTLKPAQETPPNMEKSADVMIPDVEDGELRSATKDDDEKQSHEHLRALPSAAPGISVKHVESEENLRKLQETSSSTVLPKSANPSRRSSPEPVRPDSKDQEPQSQRPEEQALTSELSPGSSNIPPKPELSRTGSSFGNRAQESLPSRPEVLQLHSRPPKRPADPLPTSEEHHKRRRHEEQDSQYVSNHTSVTTPNLATGAENRGPRNLGVNAGHAMDKPRENRHYQTEFPRHGSLSTLRPVREGLNGQTPHRRPSYVNGTESPSDAQARRESSRYSNTRAEASQLQSINPERAAVIMQNDGPDTRHVADRSERLSAGVQTRRPSRYHSPPRNEPRSDFSSAMRERRDDHEILNRPNPYENNSLVREQHAQSTPSGPRGPRNRLSSDFPRQSDGLQYLQSRPFDQHQEIRPGPHFHRGPPHQESGYGRLNSDHRSPATSQSMRFPERSVRVHPTSPQVPENRRDSGPTSTLASSEVSRQNETAYSSTPQPAGNPDEPSSGGGEAHSPDTPSSDVAGVHPSRLRQIEGPQRPPPLQTSGPHAPGPQSYPGSANLAASPSSSAPSGPRSAYVRPSEGTRLASLPSPIFQGPPTGPSTANPDRAHGRRQFANIRETLQGNGQPHSPAGPPGAYGPRLSLPGNDRGASIRGRANVARMEDRMGPPAPLVREGGSSRQQGPLDLSRHQRTESSLKEAPPPRAIDHLEARVWRSQPGPRDPNEGGRSDISSQRPFVPDADASRMPRPSRDSSRQSAEIGRERPPDREMDYPNRSSKGASEDRMSRGPGRDMRPARGGDLMMGGSRDRERDRDARRERPGPGERGFGREEYPTQGTFDDRQRPPRRMPPNGGQGMDLAQGLWNDDRNDGRRGGDRRERRDVLSGGGGGNGGGSVGGAGTRDLRKREWRGEGPQGQDESGRPRRNR